MWMEPHGPLSPGVFMPLPESVTRDVPKGFRPICPVPCGHSLSPQATQLACDCPFALVGCPPSPQRHMASVTAGTQCVSAEGPPSFSHASPCWLMLATPSPPQGPAVQGAPPRHGDSGGGPGWTTPQVLPQSGCHDHTLKIPSPSLSCCPPLEQIEFVRC